MSEKEVKFCTVKFSTGWLPGAVGFTDAAKSALAATLGIDKKVVRGSYAILGASKDPLIKEGSALRRVLAAIRDEYTIPEYALTTSAAAKDNKPEAEKVRGSYIIEAVKIEEFLSRFKAAKEAYLNWGKRVSAPEAYQRIREADKTALGDDWAVIAGKYPTAEAMAAAVTCDVPRIEPFDAAFTLADVAPAMANQLREQAQARLEASIEGATAELIFEFKEMVEAAAKNCGKRIRLLPPAGHKLDRMRNAEVQLIVRHSDDEAVPVGSLLVTVQPAAEKPGKDKNTLVNVGKAEDILVTETEYKELRPFETDEYRTLKTTSFENLRWMAERIQSVKTLLGSTAEVTDLTNLATEVSNTLHRLGGSAEEVTRELRNSKVVRVEAKAAFNGFLEKLTTQGMEIRKKSKVARKVQVGGARDE
jgi:hypothetical protein